MKSPFSFVSRALPECTTTRLGSLLIKSSNFLLSFSIMALIVCLVRVSEIFRRPRASVSSEVVVVTF